MSYQTLAAEIALPAYVGMSDDDVADALNALTAPTRRRVPIADLQARAMETGVYTALRVVVGNAQAPAELRAMAQTVLDLANARFADIDLDNSASRQMFGALQRAGVISQQQAAQIDALATVPGRSRAQEIGLGVVVEVDIAAARDWQAAQEAEAARLALFAALRERLVSGYLAALAQLQARQESGAAAPAWDDVLAWM